MDFSVIVFGVASTRRRKGFNEASCVLLLLAVVVLLLSLACVITQLNIDRN